MSVLVCDNISKYDGKKEIIKNFSYNFLDNQVYAVIGKSNSNQNELLNLICGKEKATEGKVYLDGDELRNNFVISQRICYISKKTVFPKNISIKNIFKMMQAIFPKWDNSFAYDLITYFGIDIHGLYRDLNNSKQKLFIAILSLASMANITVLDHYLDSVDSKDRYDFFNFLYKNHVIYPRTFIISTNYIDEIDYIVNKVLFIDKGRLFAQFTVDEIKDNFRYLSGKTEVLKSLINGIKVIGVEDRGSTLTVCIRQRLSKDDIRKYQKYLIKMSEVPIRNVFIYLLSLREIKEKINGIE